MKRLINSRLARVMGFTLVGTAALYGLTNSTLVYADIEQPIYPVPANSPNSCMADAYIAAGGSGMKNTLGETLNCTANDVEITQVIPKEIIFPDGSSTTDLTCTLGDTFQLKADVRVRSNAAERWDTTFYVPRLENVDPDVIVQRNDACSILLPVPEGTSGFDPSFLVAQQLDGDACGDIRKAELINDEYTLKDAVFEIICEDGDVDDPENLPDGKADFNYCAAWDNQERNNCSADAGQVPNTKAKCKCDNFPIDVFIEPDPPTVVKSVEPSEAKEPAGTFKYSLTITKKPGVDVNITDIHDIYRSSTSELDLDQPSVFADFNLVTGTGTSSPLGILTLLDTDLMPNTCKRELTFPVTLTDEFPSLSCSFYVQINDEDLPDDPAPNSVNPEELYENFIRFSATDAEGRGVVVGDDTCDPTHPTTPTEGNCSNVEVVKMINVDPVVEITKTPVAGPGLRQVPAGTGPYYVDDEGLITYEITVTNNSPVDAVWLSELTDDNGTAATGDDINLLLDSSGTPACNTAPVPLAKDASFTCQYVVDVTVADGATYTNTAGVVVHDNEARIDDASEIASITRAEPMIILVKDVAVSVSIIPPSPELDSPAFVQSINVDEPGETVVYRYTITNQNALTQEPLTLSFFEDDVLDPLDTDRASIPTEQRGDECVWTTVVNFGTPYVCTIVADVKGNGSNDPDTPYDDTLLVNTAFVKATAPNGKEVSSNEDTAQVNFDDVLPKLETEIGLEAVIFIEITNSSTFEDFNLHAVKIRGVEIPQHGDGDTYVPAGINPPSFTIFDDSVNPSLSTLLDDDFGDSFNNFGYCDTGKGTPEGQLVGFGETHTCFVRVQIDDEIGTFYLFDVETGTGNGVIVEVRDDDGNIQEATAKFTVKTVAP